MIVLDAETEPAGLAAAAKRLQRIGHYAESAALMEKALHAAFARWGSQSLEIVCYQNGLGILYKHLGKYGAARSLYRRALRILRTACEPDLSALATLYHNLGGIEHARGHHRRGVLLTRHAVWLRQQLLGASHPLVARDLMALAALLDGQGLYADSEPLYLRAVEILSGAPEEADEDVAIAYNNLGALKQRSGNPAAAEAYYHRALILKEQRLGPWHVELAPTLNNLAVLCRTLGRFTEAAEHYEHALLLTDAALGVSHPHSMLLRANLARLKSEARLE